MRALHRHPFRIAGRLVWLLAEFALAALNYVFRVRLHESNSPRAGRARWLRRGCRRVLRVFNVELQIEGAIPTRGLLVSNHLSYLDILVLSAVTPSVFVAKQEVRRWPLLGWFGRMAGTVFVSREKRSDVARVTAEIEGALAEDALVVLFPEGTSSGGETVLPFKTSLLAPATEHEHSLAAAFLRYSLDDGRVSDEVCYWRDMTLVPHLLNLLAKRRLSAAICFSPIHKRSNDRKELARQLHAEVVRLKEGR